MTTMLLATKKATGEQNKWKAFVSIYGAQASELERYIQVPRRGIKVKD